ncbi:MAG: hypothetical protein JWO75_2445 [Actinomycetia bacterium]|nr:hypothetical protein [Actinomycetes bacterium]
MGGSRAVPYLTKSQIRREAAVLLSEYGAQHVPVTRPPVPVDDILEIHQRLTFKIMDLTALFGHGDVLGAIWMKERTVAVDRSLDPALHPHCLGRFRFTVAHEVAHWRLHRRQFTDDASQGAMFAPEAPPAYICRSSASKEPVEWQADYFAGQLLMPSNLLRATWEAWRGNLNPVDVEEVRCGAGGPQSADAAATLFERFVRPLAGTFEVSAAAMRIRLEELGLLVGDKTELLFRGT